MKIKFLGAAGEVTGSCFLVEAGNERVLIDCGLFQGREADEKNRRPLSTGELTGVILTHAHLDHCGRLPLVLHEGVKEGIFMTPATYDLTGIVLYDATKVAKDRLVQLYTEDEVAAVLGKVKTVDYGVKTKVGHNFEFRFLDAGHILGSASVELKVEDGGKERRIVFSGDLGNEPSPIVKQIEEPYEAEIVVMESTYGDRDHEERGKEMKLLEEVCLAADETGGTVLLPAFSLERTQELLHLFDHLKKEGRISNELQVILDTPMGSRATEVFKRYPQYFNVEMQRHLGSDDPFDFPGLVEIRSSRESKEINNKLGAKVIIASAGMLTGGRIVFHAARWLPDEKTSLIFPGFQAKGTLGREILDGKRLVRILGRPVEIKAKIYEITTMSSHADRTQLFDWVNQIRGVRRVFLVHGEEKSREALAKGLIGKEVVMPELGEEHSVR